MSELLKLADRVEALDGPDREVDLGIERVIRPRRYRLECPTSADPEYTASLDAAMTLVPDGCVWNLGGNSKKGFARTGLFGAMIKQGIDEIFAEASTPALALTAAALRAIAALQETDDE